MSTWPPAARCTIDQPYWQYCWCGLEHVSANVQSCQSRRKGKDIQINNRSLCPVSHLPVIKMCRVSDLEYITQSADASITSHSLGMRCKKWHLVKLGSYSPSTLEKAAQRIIIFFSLSLSTYFSCTFPHGRTENTECSGTCFTVEP